MRAENKEKDNAQWDENEVNFSTKYLHKKSNMDRFEKNPEVATMLWHLNAGLDRFCSVDSLDQFDENSHAFQDAMTNLNKEIQNEALSTKEKHQLIQTFYTRQGRGGYDGVSIHQHEHHSETPSKDCPILTCSACGLRDCNILDAKTSFQMIDIEKDLDEMSLDVLQLDNDERKVYESEAALSPLTIPIDETGNTTEIHLHKLRSVYQSCRQHPRVPEETLYLHLHPEFVHKTNDGKEKTFFVILATSILFPKKMSSFGNLFRT